MLATFKQGSVEYQQDVPTEESAEVMDSVLQAVGTCLKNTGTFQIGYYSVEVRSGVRQLYYTFVA